MNRYFNVILGLLAFSISAQSQTPSSTIVFTERVHDFKTILEKKGKVSHKFVFYNKGKTPVAINDIYSDCGCIGKVVSKDVVRFSYTMPSTAVNDVSFTVYPYVNNKKLKEALEVKILNESKANKK